MEPEDSSPHSQVPANCPYPEQHQSGPFPPTHILKIQLNIIHPSKSGGSSWSLSLGFPTKSLYAPRLSPYVLHAPPISYFSILSSQVHLARSTDHSAPLYVVSPLPCYLVPLGPKYLSQHPILGKPQPM